MLNSESLLEKMKLHFPRWMDIRKRAKTSTGGKLLQSIAEEISEIQTAISEYKQDFFLDKLDNKEDYIVDFLYKAHIGDITNKDFYLIEPAINITEDIEYFYEKRNNVLKSIHDNSSIAEEYVAYYEDGYLYFITDSIDKLNGKLIRFAIDNFKMTAVPEKIHVWNVFDEFACFLGIERHQWESNKDLYNRILNAFNNRNDNTGVNSTEEGIKNAIFVELMSLDPQLSKEEIKVEGATASNLVKYYDEFTTLLDKLAEVNKDILRTKRWDLDKWEHPFKSIDYIPHVWDVVIDAYQNGIGYDDDLNVSVIENVDKTNATVYFYKEEKETVTQYIANKNLKKNINMNLVKYNSELKPKTVEYIIKASEVKDITPPLGDAPISIQYFKKSSDVDDIFLEDIISQEQYSLHNIEVTDNSNLQDNKNYRLKFVPTEDYGLLNINNAQVIYENAAGDKIIKNLIEGLNNVNGFIDNKEGGLTYSYSKLMAKKVSDFDAVNNLIDTEDGITFDKLNTLNTEASLLINLQDMMSQPVNLSYSCQTIPISKDGNTIVLNNMEWNGDKIVASKFISNAEGNLVKLQNITANQIGFYLESGTASVKISSGGQETTSIVSTHGTYISVPRSNSTSMYVIISCSSDAVIKDLRYNDFSISMNFNGTPVTNISSAMVPTNNVTLGINLKCKTSFAPVIKYLYIGSKLRGVELESKKIEYIAGYKRKVRFLTNCKVILQELGPGDVVMATTDKYEPFCSYRANLDNAYIKINLSRYKAIRNVICPQGQFDMSNNGVYQEYFIRLKSGENLNKITVRGDKLIAINSISLYDILIDGTNKLYDGKSSTKVYASSLFKGIGVTGSAGQFVYKINPSMISGGKGFDYIDIANLPDDVGCVFVIDDISGTTVTARDYSGKFDYLYLYPKYGKEYIAYNEYKVVRQEEGSIDIVNQFNPLLPSTNTALAYKVQSMTENYDVMFDQQGVNFGSLKNLTIGYKKLRIHSNISLDNSNNYIVDSITSQQVFTINNPSVALERQHALSTGEIIDLAQYIVSTENGIEIKTAPDSSVEVLYINADGFTKLKYSNINCNPLTGASSHINFKIQDINGNPLTIHNDYEIMPLEGIIVWNLESSTVKAILTLAQQVTVTYSYLYPLSAELSLTMLYQMINHDITAYKMFSQKTLPSSYGDGEAVNLKELYPDEYENSSKINIRLFTGNGDNTNFQAMLKNGILTFNKTTKQNTVLIKSGFYYIGGEEFYLFSNENTSSVDKFKDVDIYGVVRGEGYFDLNKRSKNYINNSAMTPNTMETIFDVDFKTSNISGVSALNSITACNSYNHWNTFDATAKIVPKSSLGLGAYNDLALMFTKSYDQPGYAYLDITEYMSDSTYISIYSVGDSDIYIGREIKINGLRFNKSTNIELYKSFVQSSESNMHECIIRKDTDTRYYIIIKINGTTVIDDIILQDNNSVIQKYGLHTKNIDYLGLSVEETKSDDYVARLYLDDNRGIKFEGADIDSKGRIINTSMIDWGITKVKSFMENKDWTSCVLTDVNIENDSLRTPNWNYNKYGYIETAPIYVGDIRVIKNFIFKINDVLLEDMKGFETKILTSNQIKGQYRLISTHQDNMGSIKGAALDKYVKLQVKMAPHKIINNIDLYIEYRSDKYSAPAEITASSGKYFSKILDTYDTKNYMLKGISIDTISNINNVEIDIKGSRLGDSDKVWTEWKNIKLEYNEEGIVVLKEPVVFKDYRYFQVRVTLKGEKEYIKLNYIELGVI